MLLIVHLKSSLQSGDRQDMKRRDGWTGRGGVGVGGQSGLWKWPFRRLPYRESLRRDQDADGENHGHDEGADCGGAEKARP